MSEPTCRVLWGRGARFLNWFEPYLPGTVGQGCKRILPSGYCGAGVNAAYAVLEPTSHAMWGRGACCLSHVRTYLLGNVGQRCRPSKRCQILPQGYCGAGVQAVKAVLEPTSPAMWGRGAGCLSHV